MVMRASSFIIALLLSSAVLAAGADVPAKQKAQVSQQRIFLDPQTGKPRTPTREERQQLRQQNEAVASARSALASAKSAVAPKIVNYPDGSVGMFLRRPQYQIHAALSKDGKVKTYCKEQSLRETKPWSTD